MIGRDPGDIDHRRRVGDPRHLEIVEIALLDRTVDDLDRLARNRLRDPVDDRTAHLVLGAHRVDDLAADIGRHPDMVDGQAASLDGRVDDLGEIA